MERSLGSGGALSCLLAFHSEVTSPHGRALLVASKAEVASLCRLIDIHGKVAWLDSRVLFLVNSSRARSAATPNGRTSAGRLITDH